MTRSLILLILSLKILTSCEAQQGKKSDLIKGISIVASRDSINERIVGPVKKFNPNHVSIHPYAFIRDLGNPAIVHNSDRQWWGERVAGVQHTIETFKKNGLQVMLKPQLWIGRGIYTGTINLDTNAQWELLERSYTPFIMDYAKVARDTQTEIFCIGTELESFITARPEYWNTLIKNIRSVYKGKITYAGNWDSYKTVPFWDQMDLIGVDAYFPVSSQHTPDLQTIKSGWAPWVEEMRLISQQYNKQILFAEYGYVSADYAGKEPWTSADGSRSPNPLAQKNLLQAQYELVWNQDWFAGGFLWKHHIETGRGNFEKRFTTQGKVAAQTVAQAYGSY